MNPDTRTFDRLTEEQAEAFQRNIDEGLDEEGLAGAYRRHGIKQAQIFRVGDIVEIKGYGYRVKSIHKHSLVLTIL